jgi:uncharacterized membrane protein
MKPIFTRPENAFVFIALLFGLSLVLLIPIGAGNDEETHIARIYEMSLGPGYLLPNSYLGEKGLPVSFAKISYRQVKILEPVAWEHIRSSFQYLVLAKDDYNVAANTRASYSPLNYLLQAVIMAVVGRKLDFPLVVVYFLIRLSYLLLYTLLGYLSIRFIPFGKWILFVLALAPMALEQAAIVSADSVTNGLGFIFTAWALHIIVNEVRLDPKHFFITLGLVFLLMSAKLNAVPLLLILLLLKPVQFTSRKAMIAFWGMSVFFAIAIAGGWNQIAWQSDAARRNLEGISPFSAILNSISDPFQFIIRMVQYIFGDLGSMLKSWVARLGYGYWDIPPAVFLIFPLALVTALVADLKGVYIPRKTRLGLLLVFLVLFLGTFALRLVIRDNIDQPISAHGRYFTMVMPLLFLAISGCKRTFRFVEKLPPLVITITALVLVIFSVGVYQAYYQLCGSNRFTGEECLQPVYKNWAPSQETSLQVSPGGEITQSFTAICSTIDQVRVYLFLPVSAGANTKMTMSILDKTSGAILAQQEYPPGKISVEGYIAIDIPPSENAAQREFSIRLTNAAAQTPVFVAANFRDPNALDPAAEASGVLLLNNQNQEADILFKYRCQK